MAFPAPYIPCEACCTPAVPLWSQLSLWEIAPWVGRGYSSPAPPYEGVSWVTPGKPTITIGHKKCFPLGELPTVPIVGDPYYWGYDGDDFRPPSTYGLPGLEVRYCTGDAYGAPQPPPGWLSPSGWIVGGAPSGSVFGVPDHTKATQNGLTVFPDHILFGTPRPNPLMGDSWKIRVYGVAPTEDDIAFFSADFSFPGGSMAAAIGFGYQYYWGAGRSMTSANGLSDGPNPSYPSVADPTDILWNTDLPSYGSGIGTLRDHFIPLS